MSLDFIEELSERYAGKDCIRGIFTINEPDPGIPAAYLIDFYRKAYDRIRKYLPHEKTSVIISAFPESRLNEFCQKFISPDYENVMIDLHYYQCFGEWWENRTKQEHLNAPSKNRGREITRYGCKEWLVIGEWSLRLKTSNNWDLPVKEPGLKQDLFMREFADNQIKAYEHTQGWFFWSYKAENETAWSFYDAVERGWLPSQFN